MRATHLWRLCLFLTNASVLLGGAPPLTSRNFNSFLRGPVSEYSHTGWWGLQCVNSGAPNFQSITEAFRGVQSRGQRMQGPGKPGSPGISRTDPQIQFSSWGSSCSGPRKSYRRPTASRGFWQQSPEKCFHRNKESSFRGR